MNNEIQKLIAEDRIQDAIDLLLALQISNEKKNEIVVIAGNYKNIEHKKQLGTLSNNEYYTKLNNIRYALLCIYDSPHNDITELEKKHNQELIELLGYRFEKIMVSLKQLLEVEEDVNDKIILDRASKELTSLHKQHIEALSKNQLIVAYEIVNDIYHILHDIRFLKHRKIIRDTNIFCIKYGVCYEPFENRKERLMRDLYRFKSEKLEKIESEKIRAIERKIKEVESMLKRDLKRRRKIIHKLRKLRVEIKWEIEWEKDIERKNDWEKDIKEVKKREIEIEREREKIEQIARKWIRETERIKEKEIERIREKKGIKEKEIERMKEIERIREKERIREIGIEILKEGYVWGELKENLEPIEANPNRLKRIRHLILSENY